MSDPTPRAGIALGSNLGDRLLYLQKARDFLKESSTGEFLQSSVYRTDPVDCPNDSPDFYNAVVEFGYDGSPEELLELARQIERNLGRDRSAGLNSPRTIDVDLLYLGDTRRDTQDLELPHPRITQRRFVLTPLADIRADLVLPDYRISISEHLDSIISDEPKLECVAAAW